MGKTSEKAAAGNVPDGSRLPEFATDEMKHASGTRHDSRLPGGVPGPGSAGRKTAERVSGTGSYL